MLPRYMLKFVTQMPSSAERDFNRQQTSQITPINSATHTFDITHTLTRIHNSFTRIPTNLAARLKNSIMYNNLLTDASPCNRSTPSNVKGYLYMRTCDQMINMSCPYRSCYVQLNTALSTCYMC